MKRMIAAMLAGAVMVGAGSAQAETLVIAGRDGGYGQALKLAVEMYQAKNPGLEVERLELTGGGLLEKVTIAMREKSGAYDVIMLDDPWAVEFMSKGWLADLDKLGGGVDEDFVKPARDVSRYPVGTGAFYAVPFVGNVELFAYRKDLFAKYGLGRPASWTDVLTAAKTISAKEDGVSGVVFRGKKANPIVTGFLPVLWAHGARVVGTDGKAHLDSDAALAALELYLELKTCAPKGVETYNSTEVRDALMQGTTAMTIELWPSWAPSLDDPAKSKVPGAIEIMAAPGQVQGPAPMLGSWLVAVPAASKNAGRGRDFIDFLTSAEVQKEAGPRSRHPADPRQRLQGCRGDWQIPLVSGTGRGAAERSAASAHHPVEQGGSHPRRLPATRADRPDGAEEGSRRGQRENRSRPGALIPIVGDAGSAPHPPFFPFPTDTGMPTKRSTALLLLAPATALFALLTLYPLGRGVILSFFATEYGFDGATYVGAENYEILLDDSFFRRATWNTVFFTLTATVSEVALGLLLALLVVRRFPGRWVVIPTLVAPFVLSTMVVTAVWSAWFHYDFGFLNNLLRAAALPPVEWLFDPDLAMLSLVLVDVWQTTPLTFLILLAGLQSIQPEIYEAARMDGASPRQMLLTVTLPLLLPHILLAALLRSIDSFKIFDKVYALTGGGPGQATETLSMYIYRLGFKFFDVGMASASAVVMVIVAGLLALLYAVKIIKGNSHVG